MVRRANLQESADGRSDAMVQGRRKCDREEDDGPFVIQRKIPLDPAKIEEYVGYIPSPDETIAKSTVDALDPESMWQHFISTRRPVLIDGLVGDSNFQGDKWQDLDFIRSVAGSATVKIEPIHPTNDRFGTSVKREQVPLSHFLDMLNEKDLAGRWYMTTQYQSDEEEESDEKEESSSSNRGPSNASSSLSPRAEVSSKSSVHVSSAESCESPTEKESLSQSTESSVDAHLLPVELDLELPPPTDALAHLFPLPAPSLMGGLVLQQCNLWMGNGLSGKSSGLHHDFHDNLYMLLSGRKRFLIWPPVAHRWLEPVGEIFRVHRNGLMEYYGSDQPMFRADGLSDLDAASWRVRARQRAVYEADESAAHKSGELQKRKRLRKGKARQTAQQEQALLLLQQAEARLSILEQAESDISGGAKDEEISSPSVTPPRASNERDFFATSDDEEGHEANQRSAQRILRDFIGSGLEDDGSEEVEIDTARNRPVKRQRRGSDTGAALHIPFRGLPGGLRGSTNDLDGHLVSDDSDEFDERAEIILLEQEQQPTLEENILEAMLQRIAAAADGASESGSGNESVDGNLDDEDDEDIVSDESDAALQEMLQERIRRRAAGKAGVIGNGLYDVSDDDDSEKEEEDDDDDDENSDLETDEGDSEPGFTDDNDDDDASWANAEDGEALLAKLERLQRQGRSSVVPTYAEYSGEEEEERSAPDGEKNDPPSFSRITPQALHWYFNKPPYPGAERYTRPPKISNSKVCLLPALGCPAPIEVHLEAGQMLYLPASWYHEVTSYLPPDEQNEDGTNVHMALNYWFHPPTAVRPRDALQVPLRLRSDKPTADVHRDDLPGGRKKKDMGGAAAGSMPNGAPRMRDHTQPYVDEEVWKEIRLEVEKRCASLRAQALARSKQAEA